MICSGRKVKTERLAAGKRMYTRQQVIQQGKEAIKICRVRNICARTSRARDRKMLYTMSKGDEIGISCIKYQQAGGDSKRQDTIKEVSAQREIRNRSGRRCRG